ncbi:thiamine pyrophosphate enzyme, N-terminal TPP binding domain-containing protein [Aspergillus bertholletiae]|uniref:Thiamine pyrophosphate enzyme, N-terminal TPP binding domain-containing protein n=1 Tax=Aspergillus bertholletiae TaxID=1226010 RepID=A0A5N7AQR3_9EURO|nr:thiamine pyrophosphate enzyme, N-terminal TPP binding domain-containing protein [Aspergillus bertholletiae]
MGIINQSYTASTAFLEALWDAGVTHVFVNLGSDHPGLMEAMVYGKTYKKGQFPEIVTCPHEMVALSMADGFARLTGKPQAVIVHVDVGTQALGCAVHNASAAYCPVLIFAGLSPYTIDGELRGSRTEYVHWLQDAKDQKQIVGQYCRYTGEIRTGRNIKQMVNRALQFAKSDPPGPVYLTAGREVLEEEIEPYQIDQSQWGAVEPAFLPDAGVKSVAESLVFAKNPLIIVGHTGRKHTALPELVTLVDAVPGLRVLDCLGSDVSFPFSHRASLGLGIGSHEAIPKADLIIVVHAAVPWIPVLCRPSPDAHIVHIDIDPLKENLSLFYIRAKQTFRADATASFRQLHTYIKSNMAFTNILSSGEYARREAALEKAHKDRLAALAMAAATPPDITKPVNSHYLGRILRQSLPPDTIWCLEAVTNAMPITNQLQVDKPGHLVNCGAGGLGWSGGATLGVKMAADHMAGGKGKGQFVCEIVGDGTYMFGSPGTVYWIARRYELATLTIVLSNKGWNAPRNSLELVHPTGLGSKVNNLDLNISFSPTPDFPGIAKAAAGHYAWAGVAANAEQLVHLLPQAIESVKSGVLAVLEVRLDTPWQASEMMSRL